jgi:hypothetical protein
MVNRDDRCGAYIAPEKRRNPNRKALTSHFRVTKSTLRSHFAGKSLCGLHSTSKTGTCQWLAIDIDAHGEASQSVREANLRAALEWHDRLVGLGFRPLLLDSNGGGGFHLLTFFAKPVSEAVTYRLGRWLTRDWQHFLDECPEVFPKQPERKGKGLGNWLRLPGRHHTRNHWSRAWGADGWLSWEQTAEFLLTFSGDDPILIPADAKNFSLAPNASATPDAYQVLPSDTNVGGGETGGVVAAADRGLLSDAEENAEVAKLDIQTIDDAIRLTLPSMPGQRLRCIWKFARIIKGRPDCFDKRPAELEWIIRRWWEQALPFIGTKEYDDTWIDFANALNDVRIPYREEVLKELVKVARERVTDVGGWYLVLVELCRELANRGNGKFWLAQVPAAMALFGKSGNQSRISRALKAMQNDEIIKQTYQGHSGRASEYVWLGIPE